VAAHRVSFTLEIKMDAAWHVGTGLARGLLDRTLRRDARGAVYIPASTIKGRLRNACEHVARLYDAPENRLQVCIPPRPQTMCRGFQPCIVCRLFGSPYLGERLFFEDAVLQPVLADIYDPDSQAQPRTRVKLDRQRGVAEEGHLFSTEYAEAMLIFEAHIMGRLPLTPCADDIGHAYELLLLAAGVRMVQALGGDKSVGCGACEMMFVGDIQVGDAAVTPLELFDMIDYLEFYGTE
jgi:CRISPR/Cas system CSM-associated protein Csm3 (group 7 of RAMP superfamily)